MLINSSEAKRDFLEKNEPGKEFNFGSNIHGYHDKDGYVYLNSHNMEQFHFDDLNAFLSFWFDNDYAVPYEYQYTAIYAGTDRS